VTDVPTVATTITDVPTVATAVADVTTVAATITDVTTVATTVGDSTTMATAVTGIATVATAVAGVTTVATTVTTATTVSTTTTPTECTGVIDQHGEGDEGRLRPARQHPVVDLEHVEGAGQHQDVDEAAEDRQRHEQRPRAAQGLLGSLGHGLQALTPLTGGSRERLPGRIILPKMWIFQ